MERRPRTQHRGRQPRVSRARRRAAQGHLRRRLHAHRAEPAPHWRPEKAAAGAVTQYLKLRLDSLHPLPPVTYDDLAMPPFARFRWGVRASGVRVPTALADALEDLWEARLARRGQRRSSGLTTPRPPRLSTCV